MSFCSCDYEQPEFITEKMVTARKEHKCCECGHLIQPGEIYEYVFGKWDGMPDTYKTCERCFDLRTNIVELSGSRCWTYTFLFNDYREFLLDKGDNCWEFTKKIREKHKNWEIIHEQHMLSS